MKRLKFGLLSFCMSFLLIGIANAQTNYTAVLEKVALQVEPNYDTTINQEFDYLEMIVRDTTVDFFTVVKGLQTGLNINGEEEVKYKKHYIHSGYHTGYSGSKFSKTLFIHGGTFLADFSKSYLSKFFLQKKMPEIANRIPPGFCADTRMKMEEYDNRFEPLVQLEDKPSVLFFRNIKKTYYNNAYNTNEKWKTFSGVENTIYMIDAVDYAICKKITLNTITNGTETYESLGYETYQKINQKYIQDTILLKTISVVDVNQCGANEKGEYTYILCKKSMPIDDLKAKETIGAGYVEFDRGQYFDEFTTAKDSLAANDDALRRFIVDYVKLLKNKYFVNQ